MDLAACDGDERALDRGEAAGRVEELLDVRLRLRTRISRKLSDSRIAGTATKEIRMAFELPSLPYRPTRSSRTSTSRRWRSITASTTRPISTT